MSNNVNVKKHGIDKYQAGDLFIGTWDYIYILAKLNKNIFRIYDKNGNRKSEYEDAYVAIRLMDGENYHPPQLTKEAAVQGLKFYGRDCLIKVDP